jgi:16S rRNA G966 N2-methylase RsmD
MPKTRINISLDQDLADFAKIFAMENRTSVAEMVTQYILALKRRAENKDTEHIFADPAFQEAMELAQDKLKSGTAKWHSYAEVFPD